MALKRMPTNKYIMFTVQRISKKIRNSQGLRKSHYRRGITFNKIIETKKRRRVERIKNAGKAEAKRIRGIRR